MDFIFIIYSCKKNFEKHDLLYNLMHDRFENAKCYILYGNKYLDEDYKILDDKYLVVKCGDNYENLCEKTITLCKSIEKLFPNVKGIVKCDDDIIPNIKKINELISFIKNNDIDYLGNSMINKNDYYSNWHINKCSDSIFNVPKIVLKSNHATGPIYYLSMKSIHILANSAIDYDYYFYEDCMVGNLLNKNNIFPYNFKTYYDNMEIEQGSIQNHNNNKFLYVLLHGGLGNQLFQVSTAYSLAKQHNRILILLFRKDYYAFMTHNSSADEFMKTIFSNFNYTYLENVDVSKLKIYTEPNCHGYDANLISENVNTLLLGYFQNKNYIYSEYEHEIISLFKNNDILKRLLIEYPLLNDSFFIHIRLGDYVNNNLYNFDKDSYYKKAIDYILEIDKNAHFYILSDDTEFVKNYSILENVNKTIITGMNTLDSLYFMSLCKKGGICANSTFSGWGSKLNENPDKIVICPKQWINVDYPYEIPFNYTVKF